MNCEAFRKMMEVDSTGLASEQERLLEQHLDGCSACDEWLETVISKAPAGLEALETLVAPISAYPAEVKPIITEAQPEKSEKKTLFGSFFTGLKYGMVFGLSVVCGLAVVSIMNESGKPMGLLENRAVPSFVQTVDRQEQIPSFLELDFYANSSFINNDNALTGLEGFLSSDSFYNVNFEEERL